MVKGEPGEFQISERYPASTKLFGGFGLSNSPWLLRNLKIFLK